MKHYDNKNELLRRLRENEKVQNRANKAAASAWTAYLLLACLTLYEDLGFREKRFIKFINGVNDRLDRYNRGEMTLQELEKRLYDESGIIIERPN